MNIEIYSLLESAGWFENRSINIDYELEILQGGGFTLPNTEISSLIREFWNLKIEFTLPDGSFSDIELNIETAIQVIEVEDVNVYETIAGKKLIPVGVLHFQTGLVLASLDSNFYLTNSGVLYKISDSFIGFLDVTVNRKELEMFG
jgi:hypothetical protein